MNLDAIRVKGLAWLDIESEDDDERP